MAAKKKNNPEEEATRQPEQTAEADTDKNVKAETASQEAETAPDKNDNDRLLRLMAEFDNYKKRSARERENIYTDIRVDTVTKFLPVYDNLARALAAETSDEAYKKGVEMIFHQLLDVFKKLGVEEISAEGETFDPNLHDAVMHVEDENYGENVIVQELQKGFKLGDKVIRFSMVKVAN